MYTAGVFAKKAGVTLKTIHYYDKAELLKPSGYSEAGYRLYTDEDFEQLQKILTLKFLGFSLDEIKQIIDKEGDYSDVRQSLMIQRQMLSRKQKHLSLIEQSIDKAINFEKEEENYWNQFIQIIGVMNEEWSSLEQYENSSNLCDRIYLHDTFSTNQQGWHSWFFEQMNLTENLKILELGCGGGTLWKRNIHRIPNGCEITLTDLSEGMIEEAKTGLPNFNFKVMDATQITFDDELFDVVIADHLMYLVSDLEKVMSEMNRVLKPGGKLFVITLGANHMRELKQLVTEFDSSLYLSKKDYHEVFGLEQGTFQLSNYFRELQTTIYPDRLKVDDTQAIVNYVMSSPGNIKRDRAKEFKRYVEGIMEGNSCFSITKETGVITGIKPKREIPYSRSENCLICERMALIEEENNPYFVAELETGYVVMGDHQYFKGYTLFLCKHHVTELHFLEADFRNKFLLEMSIVAEAVYNAFLPEKLNYEVGSPC